MINVNNNYIGKVMVVRLVVSESEFLQSLNTINSSKIEKLSFRLSADSTLSVNDSINGAPKNKNSTTISMQDSSTLVELEVIDQNHSKDFLSKKMKIICETLSKATSLKTLELHNFDLNEENIKEFAEMLKKNKSIKNIRLTGNKITPSGMQALAKALEDNMQVTYIFLGYNSITDKGIREFAKMLKNNKVLLGLDLGNNQITDEGAEIIAKAVLKNRTLKEINLRDNPINEKGRKALTKMATESKSLTNVSFTNLIYSKELETKLKFNDSTRSKVEFAEKIISLSQKIDSLKDPNNNNKLNEADKTFILNLLLLDQHKFEYLKNKGVMSNIDLKKFKLNKSTKTYDDAECAKLFNNFVNEVNKMKAEATPEGKNGNFYQNWALTLFEQTGDTKLLTMNNAPLRQIKSLNELFNEEAIESNQPKPIKMEKFNRSADLTSFEILPDDILTNIPKEEVEVFKAHRRITNESKLSTKELCTHNDKEATKKILESVGIIKEKEPVVTNTTLQALEESLKGSSSNLIGRISSKAIRSLLTEIGASETDVKQVTNKVKSLRPSESLEKPSITTPSLSKRERS